MKTYSVLFLFAGILLFTECRVVSATTTTKTNDGTDTTDATMNLRNKFVRKLGTKSPSSKSSKAPKSRKNKSPKGKMMGSKGKKGPKKGPKKSGKKSSKNNKPNRPSANKPTPSVAPTLNFNIQDERLTCISVISKNGDAGNVDKQWNILRSTYPDRPFCLLRPRPSNGPLSVPNDLIVSKDPVNYYSDVVKNGADKSNPSDWYKLCNLDDSRAEGLTRVALYIDPRVEDSVENSYKLFKKNLRENGFQIITGDKPSNQRNYISPCYTAQV